MNVFAIMMALVLVLTGCGNPNANVVPKTEESVKPAGQYPLSIAGADGEFVEIKKVPKRIVSLIPSNTETLFALDAGDSVVGVSDNDDFPKEATEKEKVGGMEFNLEKIISLKPDLVLAHSTLGEKADAGIKQLRELKIPVFVVPEAKSFEETYDVINQISIIVNKKDEAAKIIADMKTKVEDVQSKVKALDEQRTAFVETSNAPEIFTAGEGTFIQEMFDLLNIKNSATKSGWYQISSEAIIKENPDVILVMYDYVPKIVEKVKKREGFSTINAVKNDRVVQIDEDKISRTGPRLAEGLEEVAKAVYPEAFK